MAAAAPSTASRLHMERDRESPFTQTAAAFLPLTFNVFGHIIVDHHRHILDVDTTARHICSHQDVLGPSLEVGQCELSLLLAFPTMQRTSIVLLGER